MDGPMKSLYMHWCSPQQQQHLFQCSRRGAAQLGSGRGGRGLASFKAGQESVRLSGWLAGEKVSPGLAGQFQSPFFFLNSHR